MTESFTVCIAEDRPSYEDAVRLLILSLKLHAGAPSIVLFAPGASESFQRWLMQHPNVALRLAVPGGGGRKYDIKPQIILSLLADGHKQVLWLDSDIIVCSDFRPRLRALSERTFVTTEEALCSSHQDPNALRARLWGLDVGRELPFTANSGVIRASACHAPLLERWLELMGTADYKSAQQRQWNERPPHLMGDQEVLTAVLSSREYKDVPLEFLRRGRDIVQYFGSTGYTARERLRHLLWSPPLFFHSQGFKPWVPRQTGSAASGSDRFNRLYESVTPYCLHALAFASELDSADWLAPRTSLERALRLLAFGQPALCGLPLAVAADVVRLAKLTTGQIAGPEEAVKLQRAKT